MSNYNPVTILLWQLIITLKPITTSTMTKKPRLLLGAHLSVAGGVDKAFAQGVELGCTTLQIFTKSNRQWHAKALSEEEVQAYHEAQKTTGINPVVAHASYLINLGSPDSATRKKSVHALILELERCAALAIPYLVIHPGSRVTSSEQECLERIVDGLDEALEGATSPTMILLETMSGQGSTVCNTFEQIAWLRKQAKQSKRIGVCLDTCHVFAAGYDLRTQKTYEQLWQQFDDTIGLKHLLAIHVNDSKKPLDSRVDRHEHIGQGALGELPFKLLMNDERFFNVPKILETPKDPEGSDEKNLTLLKSFLTGKTRQLLDL